MRLSNIFFVEIGKAESMELEKQFSAIFPHQISLNIKAAEQIEMKIGTKFFCIGQGHRNPLSTFKGGLIVG